MERQVEKSVDVKIIYVSTGIGFHSLYVVSTPTPIYGMQLHSSSVYFKRMKIKIFLKNQNTNEHINNKKITVISASLTYTNISVMPK